MKKQNATLASVAQILTNFPRGEFDMRFDGREWRLEIRQYEGMSGQMLFRAYAHNVDLEVAVASLKADVRHMQEEPDA